MRWLLLLLLLGPPARAEELVLGLSASEVDITATFDGSDILVFGAVKRDRPSPGPLDVAVAVSGPLRPLVVRHAERTFGIWVNTASVAVDAAPSFYAVATTRPLDRILSDTEDLRRAITPARAIRAVGTGVANREDYVEALLRLYEAEGRYAVEEGGVAFAEQTLFRARIALPASLTEGAYATRIFLLRDGAVIDSAETSIEVRKVGVERWLYRLSVEQPIPYGLLALLLAIGAGWGAQAAFAAVRP